MIPAYAVKHDRPPIFRGDTLQPMSVTITVDETPLIPDFVCAQVRAAYGTVVYQYEPIIEDGRVILGEIPAEVTSKFKSGTYRYDIEYRMPDGYVRTFVTGNIYIIEDTSRC